MDRRIQIIMEQVRGMENPGMHKFAAIRYVDQNMYYGHLLGGDRGWPGYIIAFYLYEVGQRELRGATENLKFLPPKAGSVMLRSWTHKL